jgi:hypothetical protein
VIVSARAKIASVYRKFDDAFPVQGRLPGRLKNRAPAWTPCRKKSIGEITKLVEWFRS